MNLSSHFSLDEFTTSDTAARRGICNDPPMELVPALKRTAAGLEQVRVVLGSVPIIVTSGYRSLALNRAVNGQALSQHCQGEAVDFICPEFGQPYQIVDAVRKSAIEFDQLILEFGRWVHISFSERPRMQALVIDKNGSRFA